MATLRDDLPPNDWQRLRNQQAANPNGGIDPTAPIWALHDKLPPKEWHRVRTAQVEGMAPTPRRPSAQPSLDAKAAAARDLGAHHVMDLVPLGEGTNRPDGYDMVFGNTDGKHYPADWKKPSEMTVNEWKSAQPALRKLNGNSAMGKYQIPPITLVDLPRWMNLTGDEVASPSLQERMARELMYQHGFDDYLASEGTPKDEAEAQKGLANVWSSFAQDGADLSAYDRHGHSVKPETPASEKAPARVKTPQIQATLRAAKAEYDAYVQKMLEDGRMPAKPGRWREEPRR